MWVDSRIETFARSESGSEHSQLMEICRSSQFNPQSQSNLGTIEPFAVSHWQSAGAGQPPLQLERQCHDAIADASHRHVITRSKSGDGSPYAGHDVRIAATWSSRSPRCSSRLEPQLASSERLCSSRVVRGSHATTSLHTAPWPRSTLTHPSERICVGGLRRGFARPRVGQEFVPPPNEERCISISSFILRPRTSARSRQRTNGRNPQGY